jgi:hypothetical protein
MSKARQLADLAGPTVPVAKISGLGSLATQNTVASGSVTGLGALATKSAVAVADLAADAAKLTPKAWALVNGANGAILAGAGLTSSRSGTGAFTITLSTPAPNVSYGVVITGSYSTNLIVDENNAVARTESAFAVRCRNTSTATLADPHTFTVAVFW